MRSRRFGGQEIFQERRERTRREGVCGDSDGAQRQRSLMRVMNIETVLACYESI